MEKKQQGDTITAVTRILGRTRRALKFVNATIKKLSTSDPCAIALDSNDAGKDDSQEHGTSECSENEEEDESDNNSIGHAPKCEVNNSANHSQNTKKTNERKECYQGRICSIFKR